jgi:beta-galactosidase
MAIVIFILFSQFIQEGDNTLAVKLSNKEFASRWYPGAGLYRNVSLIIKKRKYRPMGTPPFISSAVAKVNVKTKVSGENTRLVTIF